MATIYTQQHVDTHQAALTLALSLSQAIKDPGALTKAAQELAQAQALSEENRAEAEAAKKTLADVRASIAELEAKKKELEDLKAKAEAEHENKKALLLADTLSLEGSRKAFNAEMATRKAEIEDTKSLIEQKHDELSDREINIRVVEKAQKETLEELAVKEKALAVKEQRLAIMEEKLNSQKKKLDALLKDEE